MQAAHKAPTKRRKRSGARCRTAWYQLEPAIRQESGSWKWTLLDVAMLLVVSFTVGIVIYQGAQLVGWGV